MRLLEEFHTSLVVICSGMCRVGFTGCDAPSRYFSFWRRQAQYALHLGRYGPEGLFRHGARLVLLVFYTSRCVPALSSGP